MAGSFHTLANIFLTGIARLEDALRLNVLWVSSSLCIALQYFSSMVVIRWPSSLIESAMILR